MPPDGRQTRERLLDSAQELVLDRGFAATSVDEVIAGAKSSKGAFFHHFPTKNDLGRALVTRYAEADIATLGHFMAQAEEMSDDPADQLLAFVASFEEIADEIAHAQQSSCLYISFVHDRELVGDGSTAMITEAVEAWRRAIRDKLAQAADVRGVLVGVDLDDLADHVFVTFEGAFILARTVGDGGVMRAQLRVLRQALEALLGAGRGGGSRRASRRRVPAGTDQAASIRA